MELIRGLLLCSALLTAPATALTASAYIVTDMQGNVLAERNADEERSIASITKLFTVDAALQADPEELIEITAADLRLGNRRTSPLVAGKSYTRYQLIELALISSDNAAANALGRTNPHVEHDGATIVEPTGLDPGNRSTARKLAHVAVQLLSSELSTVSVQTNAQLGAKRSTNPLLTQPGWRFYLSKTGYIRKSGGCIVVVTEIAEQTVAVVLLGSKSTRTRWQDLAKLRRELGDTNFSFPKFGPAPRRKRR